MRTTTDLHRRLLTSDERLRHCVCKRTGHPASYGYRGHVIVENGSAWDEGESGRARRYSYGLEGERCGEASTIDAAKLAIDALLEKAQS